MLRLVAAQLLTICAENADRIGRGVMVARALSDGRSAITLPLSAFHIVSSEIPTSKDSSVGANTDKGTFGFPDLCGASPKEDHIAELSEPRRRKSEDVETGFLK